MDSVYNDRNRRINEEAKKYHPKVTAPFRYEVDYYWVNGKISSLVAPQMHHALEYLKERIKDDKGTFKVVATNGHTSCDVTNSVKDALGLAPG